MNEHSQTGTFHILETITSIALQKLGQKVSRARNELFLAEEKTSVLVGFKKDYELRAQSDCESGINIDQYQNYQYFLTSLERSVISQMESVEQCRHEIEILSRQVNSLQQKKMLYEKILLRQRAREFVELNKKEQKLTDSYAKVDQLTGDSQ